MKKIILVCAAMAALAAMTACTKVNVSEETIVGNWHLQDNSTAPTVDVQILTDGYAHFNMGPGCFGEAITLSYRWDAHRQRKQGAFPVRLQQQRLGRTAS